MWIDLDSRFQLNQSRALGSGGFAEVYAGWDNQKNEEVAVKIIKKPYRELTSEEKSDINQEIIFMSNIKHDRCVNLIATGTFYMPIQKQS